MEFKGSKTEANLWAAFAGESQARNKYFISSAYLRISVSFITHTLRKAREALWPPKPRELEIHRSMSACMAVLGT